ncbi:MAG: CdaR family protein [Victivallales bacterium]|jgi:YbbR domain-containing protein
MSDGQKPPRNSWIPGIIRRDYLRKLIAVCFALLVWWKISTQIGVEEIIRNVPVNIVTSEQTVNLDESVRYVDITVRGRSQKRLNMLSPSDFKVQLEVGDNAYAPTKPVTFKLIRTASISKPFGINITKISPESLVLHFDRTSTKEVPVIARFTGMTSEDYACGEVKLVPDKAVISGPESVMNTISRVQTEPIFLDRRTTEDFEYIVKVTEPHSKVSAVPPKVLAQVEIYRKYDTRIFSGLPVYVLGTANSGKTVRKISPSNVDITISGVKSTLEVMNGSELSAFIDITPIKGPGLSKVKTQCFINLPNIKVNSVTPSEIEVDTGPVAGEK